MAVDLRGSQAKIIAALNIREEYAAMGVRMNGQSPSADGWLPVHAMGREDKTPSAAVSMESGHYTDHGGIGESLGFFDFAAKYGGFADWRAARDHYAKQVGLNGKANRKAKSAKSQAKVAQKPKLFATTQGLVRYFVEALAKEHGAGVRCVKSWQYETFYVLRFDLPTPAGEKQRKEFRPVRQVPLGLNGTLGWVAGYPAGPRPLYCHQELAAAPSDIVTVHGGEKAADAAAALGLVATTNAGGEMAIAKTDWSALARFSTVAICTDNDPAGEKFGQTVAAILKAQNPDQVVKIILLPNLPPKGDIVEWIAAGGTKEEFLTLVEAAPAVTDEQIAKWSKSSTVKKSNERKTIVGSSEAFPLTDTGLAERFALQHGDDVRYCFPWAKYICWDGIRWKSDDGGMVDQLGKQTVRSILHEAAEEMDDDDREALANFAKRSESVARRDAMLKLARSEPPIPIWPEALDKDSLILNCLNGPIDLRTGKLCEPRRENYITKLCRVAYDPKALCPTWLATLDRCLNRDYELIDYLQRFIGYCLTGDVSEQVLNIWHGVGANGKSTVLNTAMEMLGADYSMKATADLLLMKRNTDHPTALTDLHGRRLVACIETDDNRRLAEALVKELTGSDPIRARRMREDFWQFLPSHKVVLACNHKPAVHGTDHAIWRRLKLVPFNVVIPPKERDKQLPVKLRAEMPGILAWAVRGCLDWQRYGLGEPKAITEATANYQTSEDTLLNFISECCVMGPDAKVKASDLLAAFKGWSGDKRVSAKRLATGLTDRGVQRYTSNGIWYRGLGLTTTD